MSGGARVRQQLDAVCGICPAGCWVRATLEEGRLVAVEPQPDHPLGTVCTIGKHSAEIVYDSDRLRHPLRRVGPKGTYEFERISWDEAFETIVGELGRLKADHGPESTGIYTGRGSFDMALCDLFQPADVAVSSASSVLFPFGSPNTLGVGALCYVSFAMIAPHVTFGQMLVTLDTDIEQAALIVVWGANPATDSPPLTYHQMVRARERGAEIVVIDPRRSETARQLDAEWIGLRPGTDGALALGLIQVLIEEELTDEDFVRDWTQGFDELAQHCQHYRPEVVADITGIDALTIRRLARRLAQARGAAPVMYTGLEYSDSGVQAIRAVFTLWGLAGQLDVPGGMLIRMGANTFPQQRDYLQPNPNPRRALGRDRFPVYSLYRGESHAISLPDSVLHGEPYGVRGLLVLGGSIITSWPNPALWRETLGALEFLVCVDRYHTADSAYADIVLPATTGYENTSFMRYGPLFRIRERVVEPQGEARNDFLILAELAQRLGYGHLYPQTEEAVLERALEGSGFTVAQVRAAGGHVQLEPVMMQYRKWEKGLLRADGEPGFDTPSSKFEITSSILAEHGYEPLPVYTEPSEGPLAQPDLAERYPLVFNSGARTYYDFRSQHHGVEALARHHRDPVVIMNTADAAARSIGHGDWAWVETPRGRVKLRARVTDDIVPGAVDASQGGGGPLGNEAWQKANINELTDLGNHDPISGFPVYKTLLCEVTRAGEGNDTPEDVGDEAPAACGAEAVGTTRELAPSREVYLDHNATTPVDPEVLEAMLPFLRQDYGNPSSIHRKGTRARDPVEAARRRVAQVLGCTARRIVFTASGTEANNLALQGVIAAAGPGPHHIITSAVEHPAVLATCRALEREGHSLTIVPVDGQGRVMPERLSAALRPETRLVSIMLANNEVGTVQPICSLASLVHEHGAIFHTDAVQGLGKISVDVEDLGVDLLSVSAHKVYGPKGVGALYVRRGVPVGPLVHGGGQENGLRSGTENVPGIVGFGKAVELAQRWMNHGGAARMVVRRDRLAQGLYSLVDGARVLGPADSAEGLPNTAALSLPGIRGESLVLSLDRYGVYFSSGSACKSGHPDPSHVLLALGLTVDEAHCTVRLSMGAHCSDDDVSYTLDKFAAVLSDTLGAIRFVPCR
jgi:cysteine desulfurase NifS